MRACLLALVVVVATVPITAAPAIAVGSSPEPIPGSPQRARSSVTLGFGEHTDEMAEERITIFRAVVAPPEATGTVQFKQNGEELGPPVRVKGGIADAEPVTLSLGRFHSVVAEYSGDANFEPSSDAMENVRTIGDNPTDPNPMPGFEPSGLLIAVVALAGLAILVAVTVLFLRAKGSGPAEG